MSDVGDPIITRVGFEWGAARVVRITELPKGGVVIGIGIVGNDATEIDVYVSPTGRKMRVYRGNRELGG